MSEISGKRLKSLLESGRQCKNDAKEITDLFGEELKIAEAEGLHKKAFKTVLGWDKMESEPLRDFLDALDDYRERSGLNARIASVEPLPLGGSPDEAGADAGAPEASQAPLAASGRGR
jgi:hypothetical protein